MRPGAWHWAGAVVLSLGAHAVLLAGADPLRQTAEEQAQGMPQVVWGLVAQSAEEAADVNEAADGAPEADSAAEADTRPAEQTDDETQQRADVATPAPSAEARAEPVPEPAPRAEAPTGLAGMGPPQRKPASAPKRGAPPRPAATASAGPVGQAAGDRGRRADTAGREDFTAYSGLVLAHLRRHKRYPPAARQAGLQGTARLTFVLGARGDVREARLSGRSGHQALDREALDMVRRAAPFPPIPRALRRSSMTFTVPIRFTR